MRNLLSVKEKIVKRRPFLQGQTCTFYITTNLVSLVVGSAQSVTSTIGRKQPQNIEVHNFYTETDVLRSTNSLDEPLINLETAVWCSALHTTNNMETGLGVAKL